MSGGHSDGCLELPCAGYGAPDRSCHAEGRHLRAHCSRADYPGQPSTACPLPAIYDGHSFVLVSRTPVSDSLLRNKCTGLLSKQGKKADYCSTFWRSTDWDALQWSAVMAFKISKRGVVQVHMAGGQPAQSLSGMLQGVMPMILQMQQQLLG